MESLLLGIRGIIKKTTLTQTSLDGFRLEHNPLRVEYIRIVKGAQYFFMYKDLDIH